MLQQYNQITQEISDSLAKLRFEAPEIMKGHSDLAVLATKDGVLDKKTKELIALALGIASRCDVSVLLHTQILIKLGVTKQEIVEVIGLATYMGGASSLMCASNALKAFEQAHS